MDYANGGDISVWQDNNSTPQMFDFAKAKSKGWSFAGIKISQANFADPDYANNWANCRRWLYRLPYHFLTWDINPRSQAEVFWSLLEKDTYALLPLVCDFEWWSSVPTEIVDKLYAFLECLKTLSAPLPLGIYTAKTFWDQYGEETAYWTQYHLWLCDIAGEVPIPVPWNRWTFWQYTFKLHGPTYGAESLDLDGDYYNGTLEQMRAEFNLPDIGIEPTAPVPVEEWSYQALVEGQIIRAGPSTAYSKVGNLRLGEINKASDFGGGNCWIEIGIGRWVAVQYNGRIYQKRIK